jgi:alpha-glucosidase (family GH31 glycosyl hydrolase)
VTRRSTSDIIFDARSHPFIYSDQHLQLTTSLPAQSNIYGPGEIVAGSGFRRSVTKDRTTLWNRDAGTPVDENIYGAHSFYLSSTPSGSFGVFLLNSHGMEMTTKDGQMTYDILGGTFDFYFMAGPTPMDVVRQYSEIVGRPAKVPFWAFGLHMCRWNGDWRTPEDVKEVVRKMKEAEVPLETVWSDLDYMDRFRNFEGGEKWR